jgi:hypothetical protein
MPDDLFGALQHAFGTNDVKAELPASKGASDGFDRKTTYNPRPDYSVAPFNVGGEPEINVRAMRARLDTDHRKGILPAVYAISYGKRQPDIDFNPNPRVYLAVEDEVSSPSRKHRLGSIVNASLLGMIGIVSGGETTYDSLCRIQSYLGWVASRKGISIGGNVVVVEKAKLIEVLNSF